MIGAISTFEIIQAIIVLIIPEQPLRRTIVASRTLCTNFPSEIKISSSVFNFVITVVSDKANIMTSRRKFALLIQEITITAEN